MIKSIIEWFKTKRCQALNNHLIDKSQELIDSGFCDEIQADNTGTRFLKNNKLVTFVDSGVNK